jgi:hypothetical protein
MLDNEDEQVVAGDGPSPLVIQTDEVEKIILGL